MDSGFSYQRATVSYMAEVVVAVDAYPTGFLERASQPLECNFGCIPSGSCGPAAPGGLPYARNQKPRHMAGANQWPKFAGNAGFQRSQPLLTQAVFRLARKGRRVSAHKG